jgi:hypothetical protein
MPYSRLNHADPTRSSFEALETINSRMISSIIG